MSWSRILGSATLMAFVLSLTVGSVESAVPNAQNKKFYACMNKRTRIIKMLNYPKVKTCPKRHKRISWNAKGNPGAPGPAGPADWDAIGNKPPGFADGVDDVGSVGYVSRTLPTVHDIANGANKWVYADTPIGTDVELTIIPAAGWYLSIGQEQFAVGPIQYLGGPLAEGMLRHWYLVQNTLNATTFKVRARVYNSGIGPAALKKAAKRIEVGVTKKGPGAKKGKKKRR